MPYPGTETAENDAAADEERAFDQHAVGGKQADLFGIAHAGKLFLEVECLVSEAAGVEKAARFAAAALNPLFEFGFSGAVVDDVSVLKFNTVVQQPLSGLLAG